VSEAKPFIYCAVPCADWKLHWSCAQALIDLVPALNEAGVACHVAFKTRSLLPFLRNEFAAEFLASDATHCLMVDSDEGDFVAADVLRMLRSGFPMVSAPVPAKCEEHNLFVVDLFGDGHFQTIQRGDAHFIEVPRCGTGFVLVAREVFETIAKMFPQLAYVDHAGKPAWDFFATAIAIDAQTGRRRYAGEDTMFAERWRACGGKIHLIVDPVPRISHWGTRAWRGDFDAWLKRVMKAARRATRAA
jgi:hypothetical protein